MKVILNTNKGESIEVLRAIGRTTGHYLDDDTDRTVYQYRFTCEKTLLEFISAITSKLKIRAWFADYQHGWPSWVTVVVAQSDCAEYESRVEYRANKNGESWSVKG